MTRTDWYPQRDQRMNVTPAVRARTLLTYLYRIFDSGGMSAGRSHESNLLEAAMALLGPNDNGDVERGFSTNIMEALNYISDQTIKEWKLDELDFPPEVVYMREGEERRKITKDRRQSPPGAEGAKRK